ncbi:MAG TPA: SRPBCC domain-containing protein [Methylomirabilota bacterium]|nr:SRPBCC domain-containing protein [Methylomirabilota bacterium]
MGDQSEILAKRTKTAFRQECAVSAVIAAPPDRIWRLLTDTSNMVSWNSTLTSIEGNVELGGTVKMQVPEAPGRVFAIKVSELTPNREMVWTQGMRGVFLGVRTYRLTPKSNQTTLYEMIEVFSGVMLTMIAGRLPDFKPIFERYAADVKKAAEGS